MNKNVLYIVATVIALAIVTVVASKRHTTDTISPTASPINGMVGGTTADAQKAGVTTTPTTISATRPQGLSPATPSAAAAAAAPAIAGSVATPGTPAGTMAPSPAAPASQFPTAPSDSIANPASPTAAVPTPVMPAPVVPAAAVPPVTPAPATAVAPATSGDSDDVPAGAEVTGESSAAPVGSPETPKPNGDSKAITVPPSEGQ